MPLDRLGNKAWTKQTNIKIRLHGIVQYQGLLSECSTWVSYYLRRKAVSSLTGFIILPSISLPRQRHPKKDRPWMIGLNGQYLACRKTNFLHQLILSKS